MQTSLLRALIKEFSSSFLNKTKPSSELNDWIKDMSKSAHNNPIDSYSIFELRGVGQRSKQRIVVFINECILLEFISSGLQ